MAELGRQPRRTAAFIQEFPDRVVFGTDNYPIDAQAYELHFRFVESADEAFSYDPGSPIPGQGRWDISALDLARLAPGLLPNLYAGNARRILGL
jgi:predicted TIM-barrel fold metal-dependent hydrolase